MDTELFDEMQEDMPVFNQDILDGLAYTDLRTAKEEVDKRIRCAEASFPEGFEYLGSNVCSPQKATRVMVKSLARGTGTKANATVDLAPTSVVIVEYLFAFDGQPLHPRYFALPYATRGGFITIAGKYFHISPVLADPGFSIAEDYVFIRMNRAPVTFRNVIVHVDIDGVEVSNNVAYSKLHHKGGTSDKKNESDVISVGRVFTTLPHYLFARYGVLEAFSMFAKANVIVTTEDEMLDKPLDPEKYVFIRSAKSKPTTLKTRIDYRLIASPVVIAVPRKQMSPLVRSLAQGFFYIVDHFPEMTDPEELVTDWQWKVWMGYVLWGDQLGHNKLVENVETHLGSLDEYVDLEIRQMLFEEEGVDVQNIYQLFALILVNMDEMIGKKGSGVASMYGKRLMTTSYVLRDIYEQIFRCLFEIVNNRKRKHKAEDYNKILGKFFTPAEIYKLRKTNMKPFISSVSTPGDNMFFKATCRLVPQSQTSASSKSSNVNVNDPSTHLHASSLEAGNILVLPKNYPLATSTINPTALLDGKRTILQKDSMREVVEYTDQVIGRD